MLKSSFPAEVSLISVDTVLKLALCFYTLLMEVEVLNDLWWIVSVATFPVRVPQNNEKQMRQLSVIPPMMYDSEQRRVKFINMNGLMDDPMKVYKARQFMNVWTEHEKEIFKEKWVVFVLLHKMSVCPCNSVVQIWFIQGGLVLALYIFLALAHE